MKSLRPEPVCELPVYAASGLVIRDGVFYIVSDDEVSLVYGTPAKKFKTYPLWDEILPEDPAERKKVKPDFECLYFDGDTLTILPSFSRKNRILAARVFFEGNKITGHELVDLKEMREELSPRIHDLNIEGALIFHGELILFHRGNGKHAQNAVIQGERVVPLKLPLHEGVPLTITDATIYKNEIWFLSVAEATESSYLDGEVRGSFLGMLDGNFQVKKLFQLDFPNKPEGLAFLNDRELYVVTDDDSRLKKSRLFRVSL
jgi:hypothetical protein